MLNRYYDDVINVPAACIYAKLVRSMGMAMIANINALFVMVAHNCHPNRTFLIQPFPILNISNFKISNLNISNYCLLLLETCVQAEWCSIEKNPKN